MAKITVEANRDSIPKVSSFVEGELEKLECPMKALAQINIAVDELFCNIVSYAYPDGLGQAVISVESPAPKMVALTFEDWGVPYNPLEKPDPDITLSAEERNVGGLGIFIVKKTMDSMTYKREDKKNILRIEKKWQ
ncbi:MAG: ATP-binding protein [Treponema sp.]|nr:ATP-binding protein [Treponema sp.]MBQ7618637.1 ATP-binding protein [Treponema sp.]